MSFPRRRESRGRSRRPFQHLWIPAFAGMTRCNILRPGGRHMLNQIGQIARAVSNTDRSEAFYESLGLRKLYRYGDLAFFDCAGVRLMLSPNEDGAPIIPQGALYF